MSSLPAGRSAALVAHDEAADALEGLLIAAGSAVGYWRPHLDAIRETAQEIEDEAQRAHDLLDAE
jgi:hypothetical protein